MQFRQIKTPARLPTPPSLLFLRAALHYTRQPLLSLPSPPNFSLWVPVIEIPSSLDSHAGFLQQVIVAVRLAALRASVPNYSTIPKGLVDGHARDGCV